MERNIKTGLPRIVDRESYNAYRREYYQRHKDQYLKWYAETGKRLYREKYILRKLSALQIVSKEEVPKCVYCGCTILEALEVNHKKILTGKDKGRRGADIYRRIVAGIRSVEDLEVACRVCNASHYLEKRYKLKYKVEFLGS